MRMIGESEKLKIAVKITRLNEIDIVRSIIIKRYFFFFLMTLPAIISLHKYFIKFALFHYAIFLFIN